MKTCQRVWEVSHARDGRLAARERASFERHLSECEICTRELAELDALGDALKSLPALGADDLAMRRRRQQLLARAEEQATRVPARRSRVGLAFVALAAVALLVSLSFVSRPAPSARQAPVLEIEAQPGTRYTRKAEDARERIVLERGLLRLEVKQHRARGGVIVQTPDGEIEDVGTTFEVSVEAGHTEAVSVSEGRVLVRLRGKPERMVEAGELYRPYPRPVPVDEADAAAPSVEAPKPPAKPKRVAKPEPEPTPVPAEDDSYARAVALFERADFAAAASALAEFEARHPADARAEDAAYLRVVALVQAGRIESAKLAGRAYLGRYPQGFRTPDVQSIVDRPGGLNR